MDHEKRGAELFTRENRDDVGPIAGAKQGMKLPSEMNSLIDDQDEFLKSFAPTVNVL